MPGPGCANCKKLLETVKQAAKELGIDADFEYVTDMKEIVKYIMSTPASLSTDAGHRDPVLLVLRRTPLHRVRPGGELLDEFFRRIYETSRGGRLDQYPAEAAFLCLGPRLLRWLLLETLFRWLLSSTNRLSSGHTTGIFMPRYFSMDSRA